MNNNKGSKELETKCKKCGGELENRLLPWKCSPAYPFSVCKNCGRVYYEGGEFAVFNHGYDVYCEGNELVDK